MADQNARTKKSEKGKRTRGRPSKYSAAIAKVICERLASGETLRAICKDQTLPSERAVRSWAMDPPSKKSNSAYRQHYRYLPDRFGKS